MIEVSTARMLGSRKKKKIKSKRGKTKIKIKIKSSSPQGATSAIKKLAGGLGNGG